MRLVFTSGIGAYEMLQEPTVAAVFGVAGGIDLDHIGMDVHANIAATGNSESSMELSIERAGLDITVPVQSRFLRGISTFVYNSRFLGGVPIGAGFAFHLPFDLHIAPHIFSGNGSSSPTIAPIPITWTPSLLDGRIKALLRVVVVANHFALARNGPAPILGAAGRLSVSATDHLSIYGGFFGMALADGGQFSAGPLSLEAGESLI